MHLNFRAKYQQFQIQNKKQKLKEILISALFLARNFKIHHFATVL